MLKKKLELVKVLGIDILPLKSTAEAYKYIKELLGTDQSCYITVNNVHTLVEGHRNKYYYGALSNSALPITDSQPVNMIFRKRGVKNCSRIFGASLMEGLIELGQKDGLNHFFFGSSPETLEKLKKTIKARYPMVQIAGMISPPFRNITLEENSSFMSIIKKCNPDIIWVGLGAPKQEIWMYENYLKLNHGVMIGIGAGFDYLAGNIKEAPEWMKKNAFEWLFRLIQEPKRLFRRYFVTNSLFLIYMCLELLHFKNFSKK